MGNLLGIQSDRDGFMDRPPLSGREAQQALEQAEQLDGYLAQIKQSQVNTYARSNSSYLPSLYTIATEIPLSKDWPQGQILWMDPIADEGLPHTRPPFYVCLPATLRGDALNQTLEHERIHISQRMYPLKWQDAFLSAWSMKPWAGTLPSVIQERMRLNPDLLNIPHYIWNNEWVPFSMFESMKPTSLKEARVVWWNDKTRSLHREPPPGWKAFFGSIPAGEHPYELAAYMLSDSTHTSPASKQLRASLASAFDSSTK